MSVIDKKINLALHKTGQAFFSPIWNYLPELPNYKSLQLVIILTKACNANCVFCAYQFLPAPERINMPDEVFLKVIDGIKKLGLTYVHLTSNAGEPLLAPNLLEKIIALRSVGVRKIELTTNAILLDKLGIRELLKSGPDIINISTSPFNADMYRRIFRSPHFERMRSNVLSLLKENKRLAKPKRIVIGIRPDIPRKAVLDMPETKELMGLADDLHITEAYGDWLGLVKESMLVGAMKIEKARPLTSRPCRVLVTNPAIHPNGDILACACRNINNDPALYLGNILREDLGTALNNLRYIALNWRRGEMLGSCSLCTMYGDPAYYWPGYLRGLF